MDHARDDSFGSLVDWVELHAQVIEEARGEIEGIGKKSEDREGKTRDDKHLEGSTHEPQLGDVLLTRVRQIIPHGFVIPVQKRKEIISKSGRCFRCLAAERLSKDCRRARKCAVDGCQSDQNSSYLLEGTSRRTAVNPGLTISPETPAFYPNQITIGCGPRSGTVWWTKHCYNELYRSRAKPQYK